MRYCRWQAVKKLARKYKGKETFIMLSLVVVDWNHDDQK